jgi:hypothetical protein
MVKENRMDSYRITYMAWDKVATITLKASSVEVTPDYIIFFDEEGEARYEFPQEDMISYYYLDPIV